MAKIGLPKGSGKRCKVREKSGILKWILSGNPELFSDSRAWTPHPPWQKFLDLHIALHSVLITMVQYRVCDIPVKGLWASSVPMRPLTCHLSHHFAYMKYHSLAYFYKKFQLLLGGKGRGGYALQSLIMTTL